MADLLLDFDFNDPLPPVNAKKRKNVIGLDDLFNDCKKEQEKNEKHSKTAKKLKNWDSDDDAAAETETKLNETFHNFQQTMKEVDGQEIELIEYHQKDLALSWGFEVFGAQRTSSPCLVTELGSSLECLSQSLRNDEVSALMENSHHIVGTFLRGLLLNGWLPKLILNRGYLEESVSKWALNLLLYSSEESLMTSACDFWCAILSCDKVSTPTIKIGWSPCFVELKRALESYGFQWHSFNNIKPDVQSPERSEQQSSSNSSDLKGPPANIRAWIKFASACCRVRSRYMIFSTSEAQELVATIVCLFLERNLVGLTSELYDSMLLAVGYFKEEEWSSSCEKVAKAIANRIPRDLNCLRAVECISGVDNRSKQLRSALAYEMLRRCFTEISDAKDVLKFLLSKNLKDKGCNLFNVYIYFVLIENWLLFCADSGRLVKDLWNGIIRKCSSQITNTDFRPFAQEIRNRASYLLQNTSKE